VVRLCQLLPVIQIGLAEAGLVAHMGINQEPVMIQIIATVQQIDRQSSKAVLQLVRLAGPVEAGILAQTTSK